MNISMLISDRMRMNDETEKYTRVPFYSPSVDMPNESRHIDRRAARSIPEKPVPVKKSVM